MVLTNGVPITTNRRDPLRTFQFRLRLEPDRSGLQPYIGGVRSVSGLSWDLSVQEIWSGGNNYHRYANPDRLTWEPITLEQGLAVDDRLEDWANAARGLHGTGFLTPVKRNLRIDVWDGVAHPADPPLTLVRRYIVENAWVRKFVALPKLDAMASEVAFQSLEVVHEGWRVDPA
jgi:phage tail-like protein